MTFNDWYCSYLEEARLDPLYVLSSFAQIVWKAAQENVVAAPSASANTANAASVCGHPLRAQIAAIADHMEGIIKGGCADKYYAVVYQQLRQLQHP